MSLNRVLHEPAAGKSGLSGLFRRPVDGVRFFGEVRAMKKICLLVLMVCLLPVAAMGAIVDSGSCGAQGDNVTWELDDAWKLTISGTGAMKEFANASASPWYNYKSSILSVEIQSGVTSIGSYAFPSYTGLENLTIDGSVSSIGEYAFQLTSLKSLTLSCSDLQIGDYAFQICSNLESVTIDGSVSSIGKYAFHGTSLKSLTLSCSDLQIGDYAFPYLTGLESVTLDGSVSSIGKSAFEKTNLKSVRILCSDLQIGDYAFYSCSSLESVTLEGSVSSIGAYAFEGTILKSVRIPCSDLQIGASAFYQVGLESVTIDGSVSSIGKSAFEKTNLKSVRILCSDLQIGDYAFQNCSNLESVTLEGSISSIGVSAFFGTSLKRLTLSCSDLQIGDYAFYLCSSLESMTLEGSISSIGERAFYGTSLKRLTLSCSDLQIGDYAFYSCSSLESVTLEGSISSIGERAFRSLENLKSVRIAGGDLQIGDYAFNSCSSLKSVTLEGSVVSIGKNVFANCGPLADIWYCGTQEKWNSITKGSNWAPSTTEIHTFSFVGTGTETDAYKIQTEMDWNTLAVFIEKGSFDTAGKHFQLVAEDALPVSATIGTEDNPFKGIFDGNGKTLNVSLSTVESYYCAPFSSIKDATIQDMRVAGTVTGTMHCSGLVGEAKGSNTIRNCWVAVNVTTTSNNCGGILAHGGTSATTIQGCVFSGSIIGAKYAGTIWGWSDNGATPVLKDCVDWSDSPYPIGLGYPDPKTNDVSNCYYKYAGKEAGKGRPWSEINRGKLIHSVMPDASVTLDFESGMKYRVSGIIAFSAGLFYGENLVAGEGDEVPLHPHCSISEGKFVRYYVNDTPLTRGVGDAWMMTMPGEDVTIRAEISTIEPYGRPTFRLPAGTRSIGEDAFAGIKAAVVYVPDKCSKIEAYAFKDCPNLKQIRLPKDCEIDDAAFYGCTNLMAIYISADGTTKKWAEKNGIGYMVEK